jgi:hypothetical protein
MTITHLPNASKKFNLARTSYVKKRVKWIYLKFQFQFRIQKIDLNNC